MDDGAEARLVAALSEIEELGAENARLRSLLGLDDREPNGHERAWAPTLFTEPTEKAPVDAAAPIEAKLALFGALFAGRTDVYATRWENASSGKTGWSPAVRGGWSRRRTVKDHLPLTGEVLVESRDVVYGVRVLWL